MSSLHFFGIFLTFLILHPRSLLFGGFLGDHHIETWQFGNGFAQDCDSMHDIVTLVSYTSRTDL